MMSLEDDVLISLLDILLDVHMLIAAGWMYIRIMVFSNVILKRKQNLVIDLLDIQTSH